MASEGSERKLATLIFADLVGSTELAGSQDPERTRALLERFYDSMADEIRLAGGTVEKFAGDAVMAAFGAPTALEDHAERALHATLAMQRRLHELSDAALLLRIGVNTGDVVAGAPRASSSFVTGDAVNVAARLEQGADPGEILVGERTVALVRGAFEFGERRTIEAKGKPGGIACRPLLRALSLMRPRGVLGLHQAFVGRDDEMAILEGAFEGVTVDGRPRLITILGDAGVGKSRLVREFWEWLGGRSPEPLRRTGRCLSYGDGVTYWPLAEVLREQLSLADNASSSAILEVLGDREILGLTLGLDVAHGLHPLAARDHFQDAWVAFCEEVAAERPLVMLIEDVHWAEDLLLDLLERLVSECRAPLLLLTTGRPEFLEMRPGWGSRLAGETVALDALSPDESARMLDELLGGVLPVGLRDIVIERAEGNPFFVEEVLGALIDLGLLSRDDDGWNLAELPAGFSVPDTVHALVAARVDLLEAADKQGLQAASVIGRIFWAGPVYELVAEGQPDLRVIEERDFIRRRSGSSIPGDREYAIKHAVTREVAYESLPKADRAHMHAAFARWLERIGAGGDEFASFLAHHYAEAVRPEDVDLAWPGRTEELQDLRERAVAKLRQAAELAIGRMEVDDALSLLERAIELETHPERLAELWHAVARASILKFDGEGFWKAIQSSLETTHDRAARGDLYADLGFQTSLRSGMWRTKPDEEMVRGWIERALELADPGTSARAKALLAKAFMDPKDSDDLAREALAIADRLDDVGLRSFAFNALDVAAFVRGDYEGSLVWCRERIALVPKLTDPDHIALIYGFSLPAFIALGRFDEAREIAQTFDDVSQRLSLHHRLHAAFEHVYVEASAGRWEAVGALTARTESAVMANAATPCVLEDFALLFCALALVHLGDDAEARRLEQVVTDLGRKGFEGRASTDVEIALARNDLPEVARLLETLHPGDLGEIEGHAARLDGLVALGRTSAIEEEAPALNIPGSYLEPFALRALGWAHGDDELLERAIDRFTDMGMEWYADQTKRWMSGAERR
jgi:class 3 adenylate cyclase/tetratricopeptide (TPR) repeat protein